MRFLSGSTSSSGNFLSQGEMVESDDIYPLTKSQTSIWLEYQKNTLSTNYNLTLEWDFSLTSIDTPNVSTITEAIYTLVQRHAMLRSKLALKHGEPHIQEFSSDSVDPEIRIVYRPQPVSAQALTRLFDRSFRLEHELVARWVIVQNLRSIKVYMIGHHIAMDGHSMSILSRELLEILEGGATTLCEPVHYGEMNVIEQQWYGSQNYADSCDNLMSQIRTRHDNAWPRDNSDALDKVGPKRKSVLCNWTRKDLNDWSKIYNTTWFRVATSLVGLLVASHTEPRFGWDEVISVAFRGRPEEMHSCVGQFANTLPVRIPLWDAVQRDGTFECLVSLVSQNVSKVKKSEMLTEMDLVPHVRSVGVDYQSPRIAITCPPRLNPGCRLLPMEGSWDILFYLSETSAGLELMVIYDVSLLQESWEQDMRLQLQKLVTLSKNKDVSLRDMTAWLPLHASLPRPMKYSQENSLKHVHHWFEAHAESSPNSIALFSNEKKICMTYAQLNSSAEAKARFLHKKGIHSRSRILIQLLRGPQVIEWILAILKHGSAFAYLDLASPMSQRLAVLSNFRPGFIVDESAIKGTVDKGDVSAHQHNANYTPCQSRFETADDDLMYMIFTSGSTGQPKGVMVEHGNLAAFVQSTSQRLECGFGTRILQLAPFTFDASILEWSLALSTGACLCFSQHPQCLVGEYLADVIEENNVTFLQITPSALATLPVSRTMPSLAQISIGGEAPWREIFERWHPRADLVNIYGPTEGTIAASLNRIRKTDPLPEFISAGQPNEQTAIHICEGDFGEVLERGAGEICISGAQVARGYNDMPELTARNFALHASGIRMYRTGDRGMLQEDGSVVVMGRLDRELKIRGFRIASEEVEMAILESDVGCQEASVQKSENGTEMIAVVSPATVLPSALLAALRRTLPEYKVPSIIHPISTLPKTVAGKIDHKAVKNTLLVSMKNDGRSGSTPQMSEIGNEGSCPADGAERTIGMIWQDLLGVSSMPSTDVNFFDVGGHSLLVTKLHNALNSAFPSKKIRMLDLFRHATIGKQATLLRVAKSPVKTGDSFKQETKPQSFEKPLLQDIRACIASSVSTSTSATGASTPLSSRGAESDAIGVVGIAGRFPGAANVNEFYERLMSGYCGIANVKSCKQAADIPGNIWVSKAGMLDNIELFDNSFWKLSDEEAAEMDPQQRLFLEVACEALADAGIDFRELNGQRIGLFVGAANPTYHLFTQSVSKDPFYRENRATMIPAISARTAYHLNITGPNITIQNNCASSTAALSMACDAIRLRRCDMAVVGGVSIQLHDGGYATCPGQILSPRGECNPFDSRADGTVLSDAVTAVVLKAHPAIELENTPVYANIIATAVGSDGAVEKAGFQVPSARGQAEVIKSSWVDASFSPTCLQYVEVHGSATPIGDALELEGLALAMKELGRGDASLTVGTAKGNVGNTQQASGLVSLIKVCKGMQHGVMPAIKGLDIVNEAIDATLPFNFARQPFDLQRDSIIAVSAAGWGGVNTHVLLEFPEKRLQKTTTNLMVSPFKRKLLAAPRLNKAPETVIEVTTTTVMDASTAKVSCDGGAGADRNGPDERSLVIKSTVLTPSKNQSSSGNSRTGGQSQNESSADVSMVPKLRELWSAVLMKPKEDIQSSDSFLETGGDSITALKLVSLAGQRGFKLTVASVFRYPRLKDMAANMRMSSKSDSIALEPFSLLEPGELSSIMEEIREQCGLWPAQNIHDAYPCTTLQEGLMALSVTQPGSYILHSVFELSDDVSIPRFKAAWEMTVNRCLNLRTRIILVGDRHIQAEITEDVLWRSGQKVNLKAFLSELQGIRMSYGTPLSRYALIEGDGPKPKGYFVWTAHHAVFDAWTMQTCMAVFASAYERTRMPSVRPFSSFVKYTTNLDADASAKFWQTQLAEALPTPLPFIDMKKVGTATTTLKILSSHEWRNNGSITTASIIKAAWAVVLAAYCEADDVCFGTISSGRQAPVSGVETLTGPTIATVPVRIRLNGQQRLMDFLRDVQDQGLEMVPFEQYGLQNIAKIDQNTKNACSFSSLLAVQPASRLNDGRTDILIPAVLDEGETDQVFGNYFTYPLVAQAMIYEESMSFEVTYKLDMVPEDRVVALAHHMNHVVSQLLRYDESPERDSLVRDLSVSGPWDLQQATRWHTDSLKPVNRLVHDMISEQARNDPSQQAVYSRGTVLTYAELDEASTQLGHHLSGLGVTAEAAVPICFEKSVWAIVAMLGVLKAGGAFLPLDPSHPEPYLRELIRRSSADIILASPTLETLCSSLVARVVVVSATAPELTQCDLATTPSLVSRCGPNNPAYIIFSSGSTGEAKGIVLEHSAVSSSLLAHGENFGITKESRFLQFANYIFDASISEILGTLVMGGTVCVPSEYERLHGTAEYMTAAGVNIAILTPAFVKTLRPEQVPTLKHLLVGGESISKDIVETWAGRVFLTNAYGPAEGCVYATSHDFISTEENPNIIGRGINYLTWVVNPGNLNRLAPVGCPGELVLQGPGLARGYLNDSMKTEASFLEIANFLPREKGKSNSRFYRTGDLVKYNASGDLEYISRKDRAIKLRGQRIDLAGIEYHVKKATEAEIDHAVVDVLRTQTSDILVVFMSVANEVKPRPEGLLVMPNTDYLRGLFSGIAKRLTDVLPRNMVPSHFFPVTCIPQVVSGGKIDRRRLREEAQALSTHKILEYSAVQQTVFRDCSCQIEVDVRLILARILGFPAESIGVDDDFYDLGGDSIQVVTLTKAIYEKFSIRLHHSKLRKGSATTSVIASLIEDPPRVSSDPAEVDQIDVLAQVKAVTSRPWLSDSRLAQSEASTKLGNKATVFLTGSTGFLGTQLLQQLLQDDKVVNVIALVRAINPAQGLERIKKTATITGWWSKAPSALIRKLEVWVGDLGSPQLGLNAVQWNRVCGKSSCNDTVDAFIHNGAIVNWVADYERMKAQNVDSTVQLLEAAIQSPVHPKFVFISGGAKTEMTSTVEANALKISKTNGYAQTKFVAETAVHDLASRFSQVKGRDQNRISVVKPGLIIGTNSDGVANLDDFIWRLAGTAANIGVYPEESQRSWLFVDGSDTLATTILNQLHAEKIEAFIDSKVGLPVNLFWETVNARLDSACKPMPWDSWQSRALEEIQKIGDKHPLWPVQQFLGRLGHENEVAIDLADTTMLQVTIRKNVDYLKRVGFIRQDGQLASIMEEVIRR